MSSQFGQRVKVSVFGESHSDVIGAVIEGLPSGEPIDLSELQRFMERRAPGRSEFATARAESDEPEILSGILDGRTTGMPLTAIIRNRDAQSKAYEAIENIPRPSHADYPAMVRYGDAFDRRGGGHFSGRLTAPMCFAGAVCLQLLARRGVHVGAHIYSVGGVADEPFDSVGISANMLSSVTKKDFPTLSDNAGERMKAKIAAARNEGDSVGGVAECCVLGLPVGVGEPLFAGIENVVSAAVFGIPGVKGIEFGESLFSGSHMASEYNDGFYISDSGVATHTNNCGGILGGMSNGMPVIFRVSFKPTPTVAVEQASVNLDKRSDVKVRLSGRNDPCIVPRAIPCVEAVTAAAILDLMLTGGF